MHHFHVVFTLPGDLRELARRNRALVFDLLLKSAAGALLTLGRDPKWFGRPIQLGVTTVLHTWARDLHFHPHAHCIVTGGGLARDGDAWVSASEDFLLPVHVLGALFRGIFLDGLERMRARGLLADDLGNRAARRRRARLYDQSWVVYAKRPFGGAEQVYRYLGRYTHRVAISNHRLVSVDDAAVVFHTHRPNTAALHPVEFIRRFLQHRLPRGFVRFATAASSRQATSTATSRARRPSFPKTAIVLGAQPPPTQTPNSSSRRPLICHGPICCSP